MGERFCDSNLFVNFEFRSLYRNGCLEWADWEHAYEVGRHARISRDKGTTAHYAKAREKVNDKDVRSENAWKLKTQIARNLTRLP